ncbi:TPM domain-containing protein [Mesorhizobium sp. M2D.F.Ca.ET.185.01.1.1]|uniref:TPM domain-containing protein n=1 Tax=unclassified Mesorhizobium TaxID=325217 RepID=UPI000FCCC506|nr:MULTISPECIES: TPM domain-containing protein [unclassified Mesorhizobium]TGP75788.1 TPM domain-containing protein [bacterium M00.F.Ca.ET.227.01.1.1]TGP87269.1 TPM domain-containing protein [bacterium M00.F.Ca.ET.221.01.1.1]TGP91761.1 TPM domain-containing protein [bacterium M00.F.Ca.ET.222.01.1.1]TGU05354.1 TPM domain-containing protein [bacterium M00.F.Ca.ET.163.01.1.1]TGU18676.1 TPM domain-containing protein [bacterium M00.F.Ca.ET.156.01.1.1]TGU44522.1 TPM domain-containing protein [bacte
MATRSISAEDHDRIAETIRSAELKTDGEIYCVVAHSSDGYFFPAAFTATLGLFVASLAVAYGLEGLWLTIRLPHFVLAQLLAFVSALALLWFLPALRIHFVPRRLRYEAAHANAMKQFLARNVHRTSARTGVLVFVSIAERYAEVVADAGINAKVDQHVWDSVVRDLTKHAADDRLADGFVHAIEAVGAVLAQHFPVTEGDTNELDDHLVEI